MSHLEKLPYNQDEVLETDHRNDTLKLQTYLYKIKKNMELIKIV